MIDLFIADSFYRNLDEIEAYFVEAGALSRFDRLLRRLEQDAVPNIKQFPALGRPHLAASPIGRVFPDVSGAAAEAGIEPESLREYILDEYLVLYGVGETAAYLLAIRHHQQLGYLFRLT